MNEHMQKIQKKQKRKEKSKKPKTPKINTVTESSLTNGNSLDLSFEEISI